MFGHPIPKSALLLGGAGLIPFLWGVLTLWSPEAAQFGLRTFGARFIGPFVLLNYGTIILAFMSGVLWGFATKATGTQAALGYGFSVLPALWAFFFVGGGAQFAAVILIAGYIGLLALDWQFWRWGLAPPWWMALRTGLTAVVVLCIATVLI